MIQLFHFWVYTRRKCTLQQYLQQPRHRNKLSSDRQIDKKYVIYTYIYLLYIWSHVDFPCGSDGKESACIAKNPGFDLWFGKIPWRREWQPTPVFLPGKSHGQRILVGYSPWGHKESDIIEWLTPHYGHTHTHTHRHTYTYTQTYIHIHTMEYYS